MKKLHKDTNRLLKKYLNSININPSNTKKPFVISFIGLTGVGKSYVSKMLSKKLDLFIADSDKIRYFLDCQGIKKKEYEQQLIHDVTKELSKFLFRKKLVTSLMQMY